MKINDRDIKIWSAIGSRATFGIAALSLAKEINIRIKLNENNDSTDSK